MGAPYGRPVDGPVAVFNRVFHVQQTGNTLALQVDGDGKIAYDAIAKHGRGKDVVVHSKFSDVLPKDVLDDDASLQRPGEEEIQAQTEATRQQLEKLVAVCAPGALSWA